MAGFANGSVTTNNRFPLFFVPSRFIGLSDFCGDIVASEI